ncbi:transglutaminase-like domain-containing protein [Sorangium sp. So ce176]|uniref:transglutaminase-like domain-containing protein n=1 Tax=Sorangium sp. So ce176 TaxID=3133286 RepID=UPI003F608629
MKAPQEILDFYTRPAAMTSAGAHAPRLDGLPRDVPSLVRVVQGLLLHQHWAQAYGVELSDERRDESHLRPVDRMLDRLLALDDRPLSAARPLETRLVGVCRHFTVLLTALLRARGVPARARCGFAGYFNPGTFVDHWVCEHWNAAEARWVLVDAQLDDAQRAALQPDFDLLDVPRDRFVVAGDAWAKGRAGEADPMKFGFLDEGGLWFIAGNVARDLAALNGMEMLPWDDWSAMVGPDEPLRDDQLAQLDRLAALTRSPDARFAELRAAYEGDERLRVPATVFNAVLNRQDTI